MDGIFVAYHNIRQIFGFQYISQEEMDELVYGNSVEAEMSYKMILNIMQKILDMVVEEGGEKVSLIRS
jgi:hypothetical protein